MTIPRRVLPAATYLLSRRCLGRRFYLRPSEEMNAIYAYALAYAQHKHGVEVHSFACTSNHPHEVITDVRGVLPDFMRDFRRDIALGAKLLHQIPETVWVPTRPSAVELHGDAQLAKVLYTLLNPAEAGLVAHASEWPGAISLPGTREIQVRRPAVWFGDDRPEVLTLKITPPPAWTGTEDAWHDHLATKLAEKEEEIRRDRAKSGLRVLGKQRILRQDPFDCPRNADDDTPSLNPTLATSGDGPLMRLLIRALREWRRAYYEARDRWRVDKTAVFPPGTWWVVQRAGAQLA